jgi:Protein of unknown function (DUF3551)
MRRLVLAFLAMATLAPAAPASAQTYDPNYPVCLHVYGPITYYDCRYTSIAQCAGSASGRAAQCMVNPYFAAYLVNASEEPRRHRRHHRAY